MGKVIFGVVGGYKSGRGRKSGNWPTSRGQVETTEPDDPASVRSERSSEADDGGELEKDGDINQLERCRTQVLFFYML